MDSVWGKLIRVTRFTIKPAEVTVFNAIPTVRGEGKTVTVTYKLGVGISTMVSVTVVDVRREGRRLALKTGKVAVKEVDSTTDKGSHVGQILVPLKEGKSEV